MTVDVARAALETTLAERDGMLVQNTGARDLVVVKFVGPDICADVPYIAPCPNS